MPPTGAAKQHPTPTAQAGARRSSCPGTVCNREALRARQVARAGGIACEPGWTGVRTGAAQEGTWRGADTVVWAAWGRPGSGHLRKAQVRKG